MRYTKQEWLVGAALIGMLLCTMIGTRAWSQATVAPEEPYTKPQTLSYNQTPDGSQVDWTSVHQFYRDGVVGWDVSLVLYKGTTQIKFVSGGSLVDSVRVTVTEDKLNAVLVAMGTKPDFSDALTKAAVAELPK